MQETDASTGLTYKLPLEGGYARNLLFHEVATLLTVARNDDLVSMQ
ncbi:MAG: hypothetical protein AB8U78_04435 [Rickettsia slovaca]